MKTLKRDPYRWASVEERELVEQIVADLSGDPLIDNPYEILEADHGWFLLVDTNDGFDDPIETLLVVGAQLEDNERLVLLSLEYPVEFVLAKVEKVTP